MTFPLTQISATARVFAQCFSATGRGARRARRLATYQLATWGIPYGSRVSDSVALIVGELAANAVLHGGVPDTGFALRLAYDSATGVVRVEVADAHPERPVSAPPPAADAESGRGLVIVDSVATCWGVTERSGPGKVVFAEMNTRDEDLPGSP
ncbi:ATP-binding protein [Embleya sp. NBC_00896]|uniref:ATP-binding protein n=1 Tax=Embleya sp. NBC_00896 TaxID=2975961 RepID=UPI0038636CA3|nr:ATP-binding protein [Embleya sp. NBC_00896]